MKHTPEPWPLPWRVELKAGCFGSIMAANDEPVAQVQPLCPAFENDIVARNNHRNVIGERITACVNACAGIKDPVATLQAVRAALNFVIHHHNTDCETCMDRINEAYLLLK